MSLHSSLSFSDTTNTYRRRNKKERELTKKNLQKYEERILSNKREIKAKQKRKHIKYQQSSIIYQLLNREITGKQNTIKCQKDNFAPIDSILSFYNKKLKGSSLSRLSVLTKGDPKLEKDLMDGNLCLLGYPYCNSNKYSLPMIGFRIHEQDLISNSNLDESWNHNIWKKSIELCFMNIYYHSISYIDPNDIISKTNKTNISKSQSFSKQYNSTSKDTFNNSLFPRSQSLIENKHIQTSKSIALIRNIDNIICCNVGIDIQNLCVHQSQDTKLFFVYSGRKEKKDSTCTNNNNQNKRISKSSLPNSHTSRLSRSYSDDNMNNHSYSSLKEYKLSHYLKDSLDIPSSSFMSPLRDDQNNEEIDGYICIVSSPLEIKEKVSSLVISYTSSSSYDEVFNPESCIIYINDSELWILLNLKHCLYRVLISYNINDNYIPENIQSSNDSIHFSYYPETNESTSFIHTRIHDSFDIDSFFYNQINKCYPQLSRALFEFSTIIIMKISNTCILIQLLFYATLPSDSPNDIIEPNRGGFLFTFDIISGDYEIIHYIYPQEFTNVESIYSWSKRMSIITKKQMTKYKHKKYKPIYTWDNSALLSCKPMKLLPHPTYPFILVNDLLYKV